MVKRLFDIVFAASALLALAPLLVAIALWVRLDSPGPVLYRQTRVGRGGRHFRIAKFRTMRVGADQAGPAITVGAGLIVVLTLLGRDYDGTKIPRRRDGKSDTESHKEKERPEDSA